MGSVAVQTRVDSWLPAADYEALYEVSTDGLVRSIRTRRILSTHADKDGYRIVVLWRGGKSKKIKVHRLVLMTFVGGPLEGQQTRHLDGDPTNNALINLRWGTPEENMQDRLRHGTNPMASKDACVNGHPLSGDNVRLAPGERVCRPCGRDRMSRYRLNQRKV